MGFPTQGCPIVVPVSFQCRSSVVPVSFQCRSGVVPVSFRCRAGVFVVFSKVSQCRPRIGAPKVIFGARLDFGGAKALLLRHRVGGDPSNIHVITRRPGEIHNRPHVLIVGR